MKRRYYICLVCNYRYSSYVNMIECMAVHKGKIGKGRVYK